MVNKQPTILIDQPYFYGDIIYVMAIAQKFLSEGRKVVFPIQSSREFTNDLKYIFPGINFIYLDDFPDYQKYGRTQIIDDKYEVIQLVEPRGNGDSINVMYDKYSSINLDILKWKDIKIVRNYKKESKLMSLLNIDKNSIYDFYNIKYKSNPNTNEVGIMSINITTKDHNVERVDLDIIEGFNIFDWIGVIENARNIYTIHTGIHYLIELYSTPTQEIHIYQKEYEDFTSIKSLFNPSKYVFHEKEITNTTNNKNMLRTDIINNLIQKFNFEDYLEIGINNPEYNFNLIDIKNKDSVDPNVTAAKFHMTSDSFFDYLTITKKYDIIFIDGLHTAEQVYKDTINSLKHLTPQGIIVLHDCNPPTEWHGREYTGENMIEWNGTVYQAFIKLREELLTWNSFVVDTDWGCGIITKNDFNKNLHPTQVKIKNALNGFNWTFFEKNRLDLLNIFTTTDFKLLLK